MTELIKPLAGPLAGTHVVDLGVGMCAALAVKILVDAGAEVIRLEPPEGDPFYDIYPAYRIWQRGKVVKKASPQTLDSALQQADICVVGGEDYPGLSQRHDPAALAEKSEKLIVLDISAVPPGWHEAAFPAVELLAQARSGFAFEHYSDRPLMFALPVASYGTTVHGVTAALAALWARHFTGRGEIVSVSLLQGALRWCACIWAQAERPSSGFQAIVPKGVTPLRFLCSDGLYVHLTPAPGTHAKLYEILGIADPAKPRDTRSASADNLKRHLSDVEILQSYVSKWTRDDFLKAVKASHLPGEAVLAAGECWDDPQTIANNIIERDEAGWSFVGSPVKIKAIADNGETKQPLRKPATPGPLSGVRVVDMGSFAAGPYASVILGDLGADVIKLERLEGDQMRSGAYHFAASNRGKRSIAVDAKAEKGAEVIRRICALADIVHHNFRPGVSSRLGVDAESLKKVNPAIIVLESYAYGPSGPKSLQPGFDSLFQAICGHEAQAAGAGNPPLAYRFMPMDYGTGMVGGLAMVLALLLKQKHQTGASAYVSLLNSGIFMMSELVRRPDGIFTGAPHINAAQLGYHPAESIYQTSDGWIAIAARGEDMARRLARALDLQDQLAKPRLIWGTEEAGHLAATLRVRLGSEILATLKATNVWAEPCTKDIATVLDDPQMQEFGMVLSSEEGELGRFRQIGRAYTFSHTELPRAERGHIDRIGGHTREILEECGYSEQEIAGMFEQGTVA